MQARGGWLSEAYLDEEPSAEGTSSMRSGVEGGRVTTVSRTNMIQTRPRPIKRARRCVHALENNSFLLLSKGLEGRYVSSKALEVSGGLPGLSRLSD